MRAIPLPALNWQEAPINPAWVEDGTPRARSSDLARSADGFSLTAAWDCTAGRFRWHYTLDETVHIMDGEVTVARAGAEPRTLRPGDTYLFAAGTTYHWTVPHYVRKLAFLHQPVPRSAGLALRALRHLRKRAAVLRRAA